ncbi:MAG TPA: D-alanyl-D-alanine carboxypeptidase/D-alanyl-D-alanine-endopeptidase [Enhygromyxa sp.]|nr:D-alanyl-D-alanine carboxypeptidase/D-alanyl-D-alanine-endopeptidase [Enhygromyxa sp.]
MFRRHSALLAVFLLSGLSTWAGIAGASAAPEAATVVEPPLVLRPGSIAALVAEPESHAVIDWPSTIDARLAALAGETRSLTHARDRRLDASVRAALSELGGGAHVGVEIRDLEREVVLVSVAADRPLNPASNQKLVTAIAAVELLGPDYRFATTVLRAGDSLILRGEGDPDLHLADLHALASEVIAQGALDGVTRVVIDDSAFDQRTLGPGFRADGLGESYIAPSGALAIEFATVEITVRPGHFKREAEVSVEPSGSAIELHNRATTGAAAPLSITTRAGDEGQTIVEVEGSIPAGHAPVHVRRRVADPGLLAASAFAQLLALQTGDPALPVVREAVTDHAKLIAVHESAPLSAVLGSALRYSNNFTAEQVLRTLAWRASGRAGSWEDGVATLERFAAAISPSEAETQQFVNGSGLSRDGRLSPRFLNDVIALVQRPSSAAQILLASFAKAGGEGTLRGRLPAAGARVLAKTGTYAGASTLSGVVTDRDGRRLGFSILINNGELERSRAVQDRVVAALLR